MPKRILIAYGSRFGCTEEVSNEIAHVLNEAGFETSLVDLGHTELKDWPDIDEFKGIIVGSSIKVDHWKKEVESFLKLSNRSLKRKKKLLALFVCSGNAIYDSDKAKKQYIENFIERNNLKAELYEIFPGVFDFSQNSRMGFLDRKVLINTAKEIEKQTDIHFNFNGINDMRDWGLIRNFANQFIEKANH